jgi:formate hydrogenlyase subunit 6/NADH:ubiquinone oxidoreductase subunit I
MISMYLMGKEYQVPSGLTIMTAIEYAGYKLVRGSGCRAGFCGACPTIYRKVDDHRMRTVLACQTLVEDGMFLVQVPFVPIPRRDYVLDNIAPRPNVVLQYYPEVARCIACNTCTRACPQGIQVMDYIQATLRGDLEQAAELSFDCIQCGICSSRCPVDIKHNHVAQLARRIYGRYMVAPDAHLAARVAEIEAGAFDAELDELANLPLDELRQRYEQRSFEPVAGGNQQHNRHRQLGTACDPVDYQDDLTALSSPAQPGA